MKGYYFIIFLGLILLIMIVLNINTGNKYDTYKNCPLNGKKTKYTACIQDPQLNNGYIVSVNEIESISVIQQSLNRNDKDFIIKKVNDTYILQNMKDKKRKQIVHICDMNEMNKIMEYVGTDSIFSSI